MLDHGNLTLDFVDPEPLVPRARQQERQRRCLAGHRQVVRTTLWPGVDDQRRLVSQKSDGLHINALLITRHDIHPCTVERWRARERVLGHVQPSALPGRPRLLDETLERKLGERTTRTTTRPCVSTWSASSKCMVAALRVKPYGGCCRTTNGREKRRWTRVNAKTTSAQRGVTRCKDTRPTRSCSLMKAARSWRRRPCMRAPSAPRGRRDRHPGTRAATSA